MTTILKKTLINSFVAHLCAADYNRENKSAMKERDTIMVQQTYTDMEYTNHKRGTRSKAFLEPTESIIPFDYGDLWYTSVKNARECYMFV